MLSYLHPYMYELLRLVTLEGTPCIYLRIYIQIDHVPISLLGRTGTNWH